MLLFLPDPLERMTHHVSVSVAACQMSDGEAGLCWNVTAPCRLEAEVLLCKKGQLGGHCEEVLGTRQRLHNRTHAGWRSTHWGHWVKTQGNTGQQHAEIFNSYCISVEIR